jgi:hypothetical protein
MRSKRKYAADVVFHVFIVESLFMTQCLWKRSVQFLLQCLATLEVGLAPLGGTGTNVQMGMSIR